MFELLNKLELEAVLLHEIGHIKNKSSWNNIATKILRRASPLAHFSLTESKLNKEEVLADEFVIQEQDTARYLFAAKKKVREYYEHS